MRTRSTKRLRLQRSIWDDPLTAAIQKLAYHGLTHRAIAKALKEFSARHGQVTYRLHKLGISTWDWRRGESVESREFIDKVLGKLPKA
jgi:hypothetical protein